MAMVQPQEEEEEEEEEDEEEEEEEEDWFDSEATFSALVEREVFHMPSSDYLQKYEQKLLDSQSRQNAIRWLFKVPWISLCLFHLFRLVQGLGFLSSRFLLQLALILAV
jgi:hypothetical protein